MKNLILIALLAYWPLLKNNGITGTFSEYRFNHIHAGFDLSTNGKTGYPVRCFDDGYVYMIKVKKRGYGNVVYIKHPKRKLISVYGHLKCFNKAIQKIADNYKKIRKTKYPGLIVLGDKKIKIKKGAIVGLSGESGEGLPHLHFELRDYNNNPVDASKYGFDTRFDTTYPVISGLKIIPQDSFSSFNGKTKEGYLKAYRKRKNKFELRKFNISGNILFALSAYDTAGRGKVGVKSINFYLNGKPVYVFNPERFSFDNFKQSCCVYDFEDTSLFPTKYFYNLFKIKGCTLSVSQMLTQYPFKKGENALKIVVSDFHNNKSVLTATFNYTKFKGKPAFFSPLSVVVNDRVIFAKEIENLIDFKAYAVFPYNYEKREFVYKNFKISLVGINKEKRLLKIKKIKDFKGFLIPVKDSFFKIERENEFVKSVKYTFFLKNIDKKYGIYFFNRLRKRWIFIGDKTEKDSISADYYRVGEIGVFIDNVPPEIKGKPYYFDGKFVIKAIDIGKGIDEDSIVFKSDKNEYKLEYDRDRRWLFYEGKVLKGKYTLELLDYAGNKITKTILVK
ncbi:hypothetical protein TTHT_0456 [Thermotomaculum hydrothermale]|uniref:M23ase beta-sheet core domain-containing protein n=1 Tax=Thermotomaculum hydrothermale TaxID=981385 RepID=A0A7R6PGA2_9BACT|nr:M23 family metallopeptidase [Thermotomaculum hydrothermale]BBB32049.1 hypothetical protein TTHT_0456 [Thermotomaculum hydrothermale]